MEFVDLGDRVTEPSLRDLISHAVGYPTPEKLDRILNRYGSDSQWSLFGFRTGARLVGCIGIERLPSGRAVIHHLAVIPSERRQGLGRRLIQRTQEVLACRELEAETGLDAIAFYRRCGFVIASLRERYPGVERFRCSFRAGAA